MRLIRCFSFGKVSNSRENRESIGTVGIWGMAAAVPLISCGKIADNMLKSKSRDKNTT